MDVSLCFVLLGSGDDERDQLANELRDFPVRDMVATDRPDAHYPDALIFAPGSITDAYFMRPERIVIEDLDTLSGGALVKILSWGIPVIILTSSASAEEMRERVMERFEGEALPAAAWNMVETASPVMCSARSNWQDQLNDWLAVDFARHHRSGRA